MAKKIIGILATQCDHPTGYKGRMIGIEEQYLKLFSQYGKVVCIMPDTLPQDIKVDLLVLPGGADLDPSFTSNGRDLVVGNEASNPLYSQFYKHFFQKWVDANVPIFGICLGMQAINVCLGGGITADGPNHSIVGLHPISAYSTELEIYSESSKKYTVAKKEPLRCTVNSRHHQFIQPHQLSDELLVVAFGVMNDDHIKTGPDAIALWRHDATAGVKALKYMYDKDYDKLHPNATHIEAFKHVSKKICGVQWHPESMWKDNFLRGCYISHSMITWLLSGDSVDEKKSVNSPKPVIEVESHIMTL